jgi:UDP-GlcNAc3NAcA epimerase
VLTVVGARPQFVKLGPLSRALRKHVHEVLVHTGQHYDRDMSDAFFEEMELPRPDIHLGVGSGPHGRMTGRMLEALEATCAEVRPQVVIVLGDTNSTLAGALAAAKLGIPVAHVEAGLRSFDMAMPEEVNRRLTDHVSTLLFCPTTTAVANLRQEGVRRGVFRVGDVMMDAVRQHLERAQRQAPSAAAGSYYLATLHRQENADDPARLRAILGALDGLPHPVVFPAHPRTRARMEGLSLQPRGALRLRGPASYLEMLLLTSGARAVFTDSGGLQKEAFILGTPCVTLRDTTEWVETVEAGANRLAGADPARIRRAARALESERPRWNAQRFYGRGQAADAIAARIVGFLGAAVTASSPRPHTPRRAGR